MAKRSRIKTVLLWCVVVPFCFLVAVWSTIAFIGAQRYERVVSEWDEQLGTPEALFTRYPDRASNDDARRVETLSAALGLDIAPRSDDAGVRPDPTTAKTFKDVKMSLGNYYQAQLEGTGGALQPAPEPLASWIDEQRPQLLALREELRSDAEPLWVRELSKMWSAPIPNLLGHINAQKLFAGIALHEAARGDHGEALTWVEAGWNLNRSLRDDPFLITQLIVAASARLQAGALRHIEGVPLEWSERLLEHDYLGRTIDALSVEGWIMTQVDRSELMEAYGFSKGWRGALYPVARPYIRLCLADSSDHWRQEIDNLKQLDYLCDRDRKAVDADLHFDVASWNLLGAITTPNLGEVPNRIARLQLDLELTAKVIEAKAHGWPVTLADVERSDACPQDRWIYDARSIRFEREISWPNQMGVILPTVYEAAGEEPKG